MFISPMSGMSLRHGVNSTTTMKTEQQNEIWALLPRWFKEEVKNLYRYYSRMPRKDQYDCGIVDSIETIFGKHNLSSDVEGEEMLTVPRKKVQEIYAQCYEIQIDDNPNLSAVDVESACAKIEVLEYFFGSKCRLNEKIDPERLVNIVKDSIENPLPDKMLLGGIIEPKPAEPLSQNPAENCDKANLISTDDNKPAEPKFRKDEKVRIKGVAGFDVIKSIYGTDKGGYRYELDGEIAIYDESDLEPYTEPEEASPNVNNSDIDIAELVAKGCVPDPAKQFDIILKDSFYNERRLNIATSIAAGWLACHGMTTPKTIARDALEVADALIAECEKEMRKSN